MGDQNYTFIFSYTYDDFRRMQQHYRRQHTKHWRLVLLVSILVAGVAAIIVTSLLVSPRGMDVLFTWLKILAVVSAVVVLVIWSRHRAVKEAWLQQRRLLELEHRLSIQREGIAIDTIFSTTFHKWFGFEKFSINDHIILIYFNKTSVIMLPRRLMSQEQVADIVRMLEAQLGPKTSAFPVQHAKQS